VRDGCPIYKDKYQLLANSNSYLDRVGENGILSVFVDKGFDTESAIKKVLAFEV
jgi:hypothetical protein